ncbi:alpha/beta fold hydrolase [Actinomadura madurae]|uniref:alpha/beta fold hydrolase n=1 Tax=Actinomadura madurae TaxID=1993 RepID=UPI0020265AAE|nr:alpha/beta fold hydrolase [Actinomadura madurae]MCP9952143.1 alpha/beta hydrolase [Actinomadura madurae]MCP9981376.1 alpha/beta hydrolase [Actinomadura madurae]MCQ0007116.1 alpha/beta hydrolase [Actinomadura madurae]MCQ0017576.1 alpha/beta hydrolase [Actinomadura madurae]URN08359.1 alpha/beta hydrolase [Actinomadura madurae]
MLRKIRTAAVTAVCCTVLGAGLVGCDDSTGEDWDPFASSPKPAAGSFTGTKKIEVGGKSVNVSCSGEANGKPVVVLLHGGGDGLDKMAALQKTLSEKNRVCSYDRLGAGKSDKPDGPQDFTSSGKVLTGVLDQVAGDAPVVLAGHSLGGLIAARYAPEHQDKVKGLVLLDATPSTMVADLTKIIPASATGPGAQLRAQYIALFKGQNPEQLVIKDGKVASAGDMPVEVVKHGKPYLSAVPQYGQSLEQAWTEGQRKWLELSSDSSLRVAKKSEHYIYTDQPEVAVKSIQRVAAQAAR